MTECTHPIRPESRSKPERFLDSDRTYTLEEVLSMPLNLSRMPFEVNTMSPTPLDPHNITVHGIGYPAAANEFVQANLFMATESLRVTHPKEVQNVEGEIEYQHRHRMQKNDQAMERWREKAATEAPSQKLTHAEAEGVLQVRAGTSRIGAAMKLLARNPEMGAIEISKATRPFCTVAYMLAKSAMMNTIDSFTENGGVDTILTDGKDASPYRHIIDGHHQAFITKSRLAHARVEGVDMEIVGRESGLLYNPTITPPIPEAQHKKIGGMALAIVPIDLTSYVRITS